MGTVSPKGWLLQPAPVPVRSRIPVKSLPENTWPLPETCRTPPARTAVHRRVSGDAFNTVHCWLPTGRSPWGSLVGVFTRCPTTLLGSRHCCFGASSARVSFCRVTHEAGCRDGACGVGAQHPRFTAPRKNDGNCVVRVQFYLKSGISSQMYCFNPPELRWLFLSSARLHCHLWCFERARCLSRGVRLQISALSKTSFVSSL